MVDKYEGAKDICIQQIKKGTNLPWAYFDLAKYLLIEHKPDEAYPAVISGIFHSAEIDHLRNTLKMISETVNSGADQENADICRNLLLIGMVGKFKDKTSLTELATKKSVAGRKLENNTVILAGFSKVEEPSKISVIREVVLNAFKDYFGYIISGGTRSGIGKLAGDLQESAPKQVYTIGYVPAQLPADIALDTRYSETRKTSGKDFSIIQPIQHWIDLLADGVNARQIKVLGLGGNSIAKFEYQLATALGCEVVILDIFKSDYGQGKMDYLFAGLDKIVYLPASPYVIRAFIGTGLPSLPDNIRDILAKALHETYRVSDSIEKTEISMAEWEKLTPELKRSNYLAVDNIVQKLNEIGCYFKVVKTGKVDLIGFTTDEVEIIAEMEHARWMAERMLNGWTLGPHKDFKKKTDPSLVPWIELKEDLKDIDRDLVRKLPQFLSHYDLQLTRK